MLIKLMLKKKTIFLDESSSFDLSLLFSLKFTEGHLIADRQKIYPKSEFKMDTKNHERKKSHFSFTTGQVLFSKYMTIKGLYISNNVCWVFDQKA